MIGVTAGPAAAQSSESIDSFDSTIVVNKDGSVNVTEEIRYNFGETPRHGIERFIPTKFDWTGDNPEGSAPGAVFDRETPMDQIEVSASSGTPADVEESSEGNSTKLRIGDPNRTITGVHTYRISYRLRGVLNGFNDHDELYLNITGNEWTVPINSASATIELPADPTEVSCFAGPLQSTLRCASAEIGTKAATFKSSALTSYDGLTVVVAIPTGVVDDPDTTRILTERWSLATAFQVNAATVGAGGLIGLAGLAGIGSLAWRNGRDRRYSGSAVDAAFGNADGDERPVPLFDKPVDTVEFVPPEGIRPGHMGTLWDEQANHLDVSAMIVDLAVRGWLRIDEIAPRESKFMGFGNSSGDYHLVQLRDPVSDPRATELWEAEKTLMSSLFALGDTIVLSALKTTFSDKLAMIESTLYDDSVAAGWFPIRPDRVRSRWVTRGVLLIIVGVAIVFAAARFTHLGLVFLPIPICGLVLVASARFFPRRTAKGSALLGRVRGFKELFDAGEGERQQFAEAHHIFAQYLPYAIVFGCTDKWAETFEGLGLTPEEMGLGVWYTSPYGYSPIHFGYAMGSFTTQTSGSLAAAAPSSSGGASSGGSGFSGGFSGGGFGGGGGGSW